MKKRKLILAIILSISTIFKLNYNINAQAAEEEEIVYEYINLSKCIPHTIIKTGSKVQIKLPEHAKQDKIEYVYASEDKSILTVNQKGLIKAIAKGETVLTIAPKKSPDNGSWVGITVTDRIIKISGVKKCVAGKTYQLKASEKDVIWNCSNLYGENANASIDAKTGKLKVRNAGTIYVSCTSKDGKALGAVYIYATGPVIEQQDIVLDKIVIKKDEHLIDSTELIASDKLPKTVKVPYTHGKKKGEVELSVIWSKPFFTECYDKKGIYTIQGYLKAPEGYFLDEDSNIKVDVEFKKEQTDNRKKIVSIEPLETIIIDKDEHISYFRDAMKDTKLVCNLQDGSTVEFSVGWISYKEEYISAVGTYEFVVGPSETPGYNTGDYDDGPSVKLTIKVNKKQTYLRKAATLDDIAGESWVIEHTSQDPIK